MHDQAHLARPAIHHAPFITRSPLLASCVPLTISPPVINDRRSSRSHRQSHFYSPSKATDPQASLQTAASSQQPAAHPYFNQ